MSHILWSGTLANKRSYHKWLAQTQRKLDVLFLFVGKWLWDILDHTISRKGWNLFAIQTALVNDYPQKTGYPQSGLGHDDK